MKIDVSELLKDVGAEDKVSGIEKLSFKDDGLNLTAPVEMDLKLLNTGETVLVTGTIKTKVKLNCCRCLKDFDAPVILKIDEQYRKKQPVSRKKLEEDEEVELKDDDIFFDIGEDNVIDMDEAVRQNILVSLPLKPLCNKLCKGIEIAGTLKKKAPDPRLTKLGRLVLRSKTKEEK